MKVKWTHCKYCGARLSRDIVGQYCLTKNCQWHHGLPASEDSKTTWHNYVKRKKKEVDTP
jgi:hypothetical protein